MKICSITTKIMPILKLNDNFYRHKNKELIKEYNMFACHFYFKCKRKPICICIIFVFASNLQMRNNTRPHPTPSFLPRCTLSGSAAKFYIIWRAHKYCNFNDNVYENTAQFYATALVPICICLNIEIRKAILHIAYV